MADLCMDVDVNLAEVPVNIMPLLDDTDFKTIEDAVVYNQAGLALFWNFITTAGAQTCTAVTPTSGGTHDWTDQGTSGLYAIAIPATGGASVSNDTEGFGWFTGKATGVLPWRGPVICFRAAALNNSLIDAGATGLLAPATAARTLVVDANGLADANVVKVGPTGSGTAQTAGDIIGDTNDIQARLPAALTAGGNIKADALAWNGLTTVALPLVPTTAGRTLDVSATGEAGLDWANIGSPTTAQNLSATNIDVDQVVASVSGAVGSVTGSVGSVAAGGITAASIATDAIDADALAADAVTEIQAGLATSAALATVQADTDNIQTRLPAALVGGRMDASVGAMAAAVVTAAAIATDAIDADALAADAVAEIVDGVWDEAIAGHLGAGSTGAALNAAGAAGDPWTTALPGAYGAGTAGFIVGTNLDDTVSSRLEPTVAGRTLDVSAAGNAGIDWSNIEAPATAQNLAATNIDPDQVVASVTGAVGSVTGAVGSVAAGGITAASIATGAVDADALAADAVAEIADGVWDEAIAGHLGAGSTGLALNSGSVAAVAVDARLPVDPADESSIQAAIAATEATILDLMLAYTQLLARKDAAIAADRAAELAQINANEGTGAGTYANTTDALEAIRDSFVEGFQKNVAFPNFEFDLVQSADHVSPAVGLAVTAFRSIDGAAYGFCANVVAEVGSGTYKIDLAASDLNGDMITFWFSAVGADARKVTVKTSDA